MTNLSDISRPYVSTLGRLSALAASVISASCGWIAELNDRDVLAVQLDRLDDHALADLGIVRRTHKSWTQSAPGFEPTPTMWSTYHGRPQQ